MDTIKTVPKTWRKNLLDLAIQYAYAEVDLSKTKAQYDDPAWKNQLDKTRSTWLAFENAVLAIPEPQ